MSAFGQYVPPPLKIEFPEQLALSDSINGSRRDVAASEIAVSSLKNYVAVSVYPVGCPIPCPTDIPPSDDFFIMKGQEFDPVENPILAGIYGTHLEDMRGLAIVGKKDGETILAYQADGNKSHSHRGTARSVSLGTKSTNTTGNHNHGYSAGRSNRTEGIAGRGNGTDQKTTLYTASNGNHRHTIAMGSHGHVLDISSEGGAENTIKNKKFNWMVRKG